MVTSHRRCFLQRNVYSFSLNITFFVEALSLEGIYSEGSVSLFSQVTNYKIRGNGLELCQGRFRVDIKRLSVMERVVKQWNRLPMEVVKSLSMEVFERYVHLRLGSVVTLVVVVMVLIGEQLNSTTFEVFGILMIL